MILVPAIEYGQEVTLSYRPDNATDSQVITLSVHPACNQGHNPHYCSNRLHRSFSTHSPASNRH